MGIYATFDDDAREPSRLEWIPVFGFGLGIVNRLLGKPTIFDIDRGRKELFTGSGEVKVRATASRFVPRGLVAQGYQVVITGLTIAYGSMWLHSLDVQSQNQGLEEVVEDTFSSGSVEVTAAYELDNVRVVQFIHEGKVYEATNLYSPDSKKPDEEKFDLLVRKDIKELGERDHTFGFYMPSFDTRGYNLGLSVEEGEVIDLASKLFFHAETSGTILRFDWNFESFRDDFYASRG